MLNRLALTARETAARTAQTAVLGLGAILMLAIGMIFLTIAAWIGIAAASSTMTAALVIGAGYFGLGLIMLAVLSMRRRAIKRARLAAVAAPPVAPTLPVLVSEVILAFVGGMRAGQKSRR